MELPSRLKGIEREPLFMTVQVKDPEAPVHFYVGGQRVTEEVTDIGGCNKSR